MRSHHHDPARIVPAVYTAKKKVGYPYRCLRIAFAAPSRYFPISMCYILFHNSIL